MFFLRLGIILTLLSGYLFAQEADTLQKPKIWSSGFISGLTFTQASFSNWVAGGDNNAAVNSLFHGMIDLEKGDWSWENSLELHLGARKLQRTKLRKIQDKNDFRSKLNYHHGSNFHTSLLLDLRSQLMPGYGPFDDTLVISRIMSPGFFILALGVDYKPTKGASIVLSPITGKLTFVLDQKIADLNLYGNDPNFRFYDPNITQVHSPKIRYEVGAALHWQLKRKFFKDLLVMNQIDIFWDYTNPDHSRRYNVDINSELRLIYKLKNWLSAHLDIQCVYDHDILVPIYEWQNDQKVEIGAGPRTQFKEVFGFGLTFHLGSDVHEEEE